MKRREEVPTVTPQYMAAWARLFARSPAELEEQRRAALPAMTGTKQKRSTPTTTNPRGVA